MRIGLSVEALSPEPTGIGRYCWELVQWLPRQAEVTSVSHYLGDVSFPDPSLLLRSGRLARWRRRMHRTLTPAHRRRAKPGSVDLVHGPNYMLPDWVDRGVMTVHDLSVFKYPETHPPVRIAAFERHFERSLQRAAHLITDCETIRREVMEFTGFPAERVTAVPLGVSDSFRPVAARERPTILAKHPFPARGYGLTISTLEPRKRIDCLLAAWRGLPRALRDRFPLVVAGAAGWRNEDLQAQMDRAASEGWLIRRGFVADDDLPALYSGASLFVFPSKYEGFGLPPVEAMASGVPTIVADNGSLAEVTRGAAMLVQPEDIQGFTSAIEQGLEDQAWRERAISAGIQVARDYTWANCAERTVDVYRRVLATE